LNTERDKQNTSIISPTNTLSTIENEKLMGDIQMYEKRIQALIDGIGMLKEQVNIPITYNYFIDQFSNRCIAMQIKTKLINFVRILIHLYLN
jgi:hypothetical protein